MYWGLCNAHIIKIVSLVVARLVYFDILIFDIIFHYSTENKELLII